jgi:hypothetical protein
VFLFTSVLLYEFHYVRGVVVLLLTVLGWFCVRAKIKLRMQDTGPVDIITVGEQVETGGTAVSVVLVLHLLDTACRREVHGSSRHCAL